MICQSQLGAEAQRGVKPTADVLVRSKLECCSRGSAFGERILRSRRESTRPRSIVATVRGSTVSELRAIADLALQHQWLAFVSLNAGTRMNTKGWRIEER